MPTEAEVWSEFQEKAQANYNLAYGSTKLLATKDRRGRLSPVGAGVLLAVGPECFLLTAEHVVAELGSTSLWIGLGDRYVRVGAEGCSSDTGPDGTDPRDAAVLSVDWDKSEREVVRDSAIRIEDIAPQRPDYEFGMSLPGVPGGYLVIPMMSIPGFPSVGVVIAADHPAFYQIVGAPASRFRTDDFGVMKPKFFSWFGPFLSRQELVSKGHSRALHVGFHCPSEFTITDGSVITLPKMGGVSGSPIWELPPYGQSSLHGHTGKLAAVVTSYRPAKTPNYFLGTKISVFLQLIRRLRPQLEHPMLPPRVCEPLRP